jgi:predicted glycogen debranching enzyme
MIEFGRDICGDIQAASQKEWLVTNGIGGFAAGTLAGILTRRYHGILIAALNPPLGRTLLATSVDETIEYNDQEFRLYAQHRLPNSPSPQGFRWIERFFLDGSIPTWHFSFSDVLLEKQIWMEYGENTTYIRYTMRRGSGIPIHLNLGVLINWRDFHGATHANQAPDITLAPCSDGIHFKHQDLPTDGFIRASHGKFILEPAWQCNFYLSAEAGRGESAVEDHLLAGHFEILLHASQAFTLAASTHAGVNLDGQTALARRKDYEARLLSQAANLLAPGAPPALSQLVLAADQFIANRPTSEDAGGKTILAGYPWFSDWGRDTMISLPGLTLVTGRPEIARSILRTYARFVDQGMLPNRFPDQGEDPEYNTVDATLWFFEALRTYLVTTGDQSLISEIYPALMDIIDWHVRGTRYEIRYDSRDGLLSAGNRDTQLTWMDVKIDGWAVTPRCGKAVEINALWYNALCCMADFSKMLGRPAGDYQRTARKARRGFSRFWNSSRGGLFDVLDERTGADPTLRPNQIIAAALHHSPLSAVEQKAVVDLCARDLLTSLGLRSLAPNEPGYIGHYGGDRWQRDSAYHQGTVWGWLIGPFISAHLRVYRDPSLAWSFLQPFFNHLSDHGLGSISEIFNGDAPYHPNGCIAQAWSVAEVLRAAHMIQSVATG